jgi:hypothetical protein
MKMNHVAVFVAVLFGALPSAFAQRAPLLPPASPIQAKLVIPDTKILPGVPFEMWIEVRNPSDASVCLGLAGDLIVEPEGKEPFTITRGGADGQLQYPTLLPEKDVEGSAVWNLVLRPRESRTLTLPILRDLQGPNYFADERLSKPGRYTISLRLDYRFGAFETPQKSLLPPEFLGPVTTNEVTVERITPTGTDAAVWQRIQELSHGRWSSVSWMSSEAGQAVIVEIIDKYKDSNYYPYALLASTFGAVNEQAHNRFVDARKRFPNSPVAELLEQYVWLTAISTHKSMDVYNAHYGKLKASRRPTTRILVFGREDLPKEPCPPGYDCED